MGEIAYYILSHQYLKTRVGGVIYVRTTAPRHILWRWIEWDVNVRGISKIFNNCALIPARIHLNPITKTQLVLL